MGRIASMTSMPTAWLRWHRTLILHASGNHGRGGELHSAAEAPNHGERRRGQSRLSGCSAERRFLDG
jgi:hypothetical protein